MSKLKYILIICFVMYGKLSYAVGGCLLPDKKVYTSKGGGGYYDPGASTSLSAGYCNWTPASGPSCNVCNTGLFFGICLTGSQIGIEAANFSMVPCPIDDSIPFLLLGTGGLGFFVLRRRNLIQLGQN
ncbi:hypothetical protein [Pedobacter punctiformis]|uniref:PEP-CTERM protein-sorting domain-containing protein n=1 Tax=Pedobacter punctiformis TaxID=3004097 RepID=A0ABT4L9S7_9SPHI|nr:hypothetical protein [Pedobacter sp. HCMS5-2]MCZ4244687.1 hypothetical protein [Pedobacter sp. HCMS5-2]